MSPSETNTDGNLLSRWIVSFHVHIRITLSIRSDWSAACVSSRSSESWLSTAPTKTIQPIPPSTRPCGPPSSSLWESSARVYQPYGRSSDSCMTLPSTPWTKAVARTPTHNPRRSICRGLSPQATQTTARCPLPEWRPTAPGHEHHLPLKRRRAGTLAGMESRHRLRRETSVTRSSMGLRGNLLTI